MTMQIINLEQGSPEWLAHRERCFNASDVPAMLGISPYKTRTQLLDEMAFGIAMDVDAATQRRFDDGHRFEALARPMAEKILDDDLYPVIATEDKYGLSRLLSASSDGLNMSITKNFEHKSLNDDLRDVFDNDKPLLELHTSQMEQQHMVFGVDETLFVASKFDASDEVVDQRSRIYKSDQAMRQRIIDGWAQFEKDLANHVPVEAIPVAVAAPIRDLPSITYKMHGMALSTNLHQDVKPAILILVEQSKRPLETDQDFADLDALCKKFALAEDQCELIAAQVDAEFKDPDKFKKDLKELQELMAQARIAGKKRVTSEKDTRKAKIISDARETYIAHIAALEVETKPIKLNLPLPDFIGAIKGMAKLDNIKGKCDDIIASSKITADATAKDVRTKLTWCKENAAGMSALFPDLQALMAKPLEDFTLTITSRIEKQKADEAARLEAERTRMEAEAKAKAEAEAAIKLKADEERIRAEERAKAEAEQRAKAEAQAKIDAKTAAALAAESAKNGTQENNHQSEAVTHDSARPALEQTKHAVRPAVTWPFPTPDMQKNTATAAPVVSKRPTKMQMVEAVAKEFGVSVCTADEWLMGAFKQLAA